MCKASLKLGNHGRLATMADIGGVPVATRAYSAMRRDHVIPSERPAEVSHIGQ